MHMLAGAAVCTLTFQAGLRKSSKPWQPLFSRQVAHWGLGVLRGAKLGPLCKGVSCNTSGSRLLGVALFLVVKILG